MQDDDPFEKAASLQLPSHTSAPTVAPAEDESDDDDELVSTIKQSSHERSVLAGGRDRDDEREDDHQDDAAGICFAGTSSPVTLSLMLVVFGILGMATLMLSGAAEASSPADSTFPASASTSHSRPCPSPRYEFVRNGLYDCALYELHDMSRCASFATMASDVHGHRDTLAAACAEKCDATLDCAGFSAVEAVERGCWLYSRLEDAGSFKSNGPRHQDEDRRVGVVSHVHSVVCAKTSTVGT